MSLFTNKVLLFTLFFFYFSHSAFSQDAFVSTWKTDNPGSSNNNQITVPGSGTYDVFWEEVSNPQNFGSISGIGNITLTFTNSGIYRLKITGSLQKIRFDNGGDKLKLLSIDNWGIISWTGMNSAFKGCANMTYSATDAPNLSNVTDCTSMFEACSSFNGAIGNWDVSNVQIMRNMFKNATTFNQDIGTWNTSKVKNTHGMFENASSFNQNIGGWSTSKFNEMRFMFKGASAFNQPIGGWDVSFASNMGSLFDGAFAFNQDIGNWDTNRVSYMGFMFRGASAFNQDIGNWNTSNVIKTRSMFEGAFAFNQNIGNWDITKVADMEYMLTDSGLSIDNYNATLKGWANQSVLSNITLGAHILQYCEGENARNALINNYNWTFVGDTQASVCPFVSIWKTDNPGTSNDNQVTIPIVGVYTIDWEEVGNPANYGTETGIDTYTITFPTAGTYQLKLSGIMANIRFDNSGDKEKLLSLDYWGTNAWSDMNSAFEGCSNLTYTATDRPNLNNVSDCIQMFQFCSNFNGNLDNWDVSNVENMNRMFSHASTFNGAIGSWDVSNVKNMKEMFQYAYAFNQDIGAWDLSRVFVTSFMFQEAHSFNQYIGNWNTSKVLSMRFMFDGAAAFNQDISAWDLTKVNNLNSMFEHASAFNQDISAWNVSKVARMKEVFKDATAFNQNLANWDISKVTEMDAMLDNSNLSTANYDATLIGWANQAVQANVTLGAAGLKYCTAAAARDTLINNYNWIINNDAFNCENLIQSIPLDNKLLSQTSPQLLAYPNPTDAELTITHPEAEQVQIQIFNANGQSVPQQWLMTKSSNSRKTIDVSMLPSGLYFIKTENGARTTFVKH